MLNHPSPNTTEHLVAFEHEVARMSDGLIVGALEKVVTGAMSIDELRDFARSLADPGAWLPEMATIRSITAPQRPDGLVTEGRARAGRRLREIADAAAKGAV